MYEVDEKVLQATLQYLATRPFQEVADLINVLRQSKPTEPTPSSEAKNENKKEKA